MAPGLELNLLLFLLLFLLFTTPARAQGPQPSEVNGAVGGVALLSPQSPQNLSKYSEIHWRWQNLMKIAIRGRGKRPEYPQDRFWGRLKLLEDGTLRVSDLSLGDGGEYQLHLEEDTGTENVHRVLLRVYALVPKPRVTATTSGDSQVCNATLSCSVALPGVTYEWIPPQRAPMSEGPVLELSVSPAAGTYVCRVSNPASSSNASLTLRRPCSWTDESSSSSSSAPGAPLAFAHLALLFLLLAVA